jgi:hypothetical protein
MEKRIKVSSRLFFVTVLALTMGFFLGAFLAPFRPSREKLASEATGEKDLVIQKRHALVKPPETLLALIESVNNTDERRGIIAAELKNNNDEQLRMLLKDISGRPPSFRLSQVVTAIYKRWGQIDPPAAIASTHSLNGRERTACFAAVLDGWVCESPAAVWQYLKTQPPENVKNTATFLTLQGQYSRLIDDLLENGQADVVKSLIEQTPSDARGMAGSKLGLYLAKYDTAAALAWISEVPKGSARTNALSGTVIGLADEAPEVAADFAINLPDNGDRIRSLIDVFREWALAGDPTAAQNWFAKTAISPDRDLALASYIKNFAPADPTLALSMMATFSDPEARNRAFESGLKTLSSTNPAAALDWVLTSSASPGDRLQKLQAVVSTWARQDRLGALTNLTYHAGLSQEERTELISTVSNSKARE